MKLIQDKTNITLTPRDGAIIFRERCADDVDLECYLPNAEPVLASDVAFTVAMLMWLLNNSAATDLLSQTVDDFTADLDRQKRKDALSRCQ